MVSEKGKLLSIIVPVYNVERFLPSCLDSLLAQNIEASEYDIICVNDGSTDNSLAVLQSYAQKYENVIVVDKPNGGVSSARNAGLKLSPHGQYVWFIDADDWIARNSLGIIKESIERYSPSVIQVHYDWIKAEWRIKECLEKALDISNVHYSVHSNLFMKYDGAWSTIIQKDLLLKYDHTFREDLHYGEDILFIRDLFDTMRLSTENAECNYKIVHLNDEVIYYYRMHDESAMRTSWIKNRQKYAMAMLQLARTNTERMQDRTKPSWYTEQYEELFCQRMYNYLIHWLPGLHINILEHMAQLRQEKLYPLPASMCKKMYEEFTQNSDFADTIKYMYICMVLRCSWLYPLYYWQMKRKYIRQVTQAGAK